MSTQIELALEVRAEGPALPALRYRLSLLRGSSEKYGPCEVCGGRVSEVSLQVEERRLDTDDADPASVRKDPYYHAGSTFGHEACLIGAREADLG